VVTEWEANLFLRQVPKPREIVPEVGTQEDPDEDSPVHMRGKKEKKRKETVSFRCQGGKM